MALKLKKKGHSCRAARTRHQPGVQKQLRPKFPHNPVAGFKRRCWMRNSVSFAFLLPGHRRKPRKWRVLLLDFGSMIALLGAWASVWPCGLFSGRCIKIDVICYLPSEWPSQPMAQQVDCGAPLRCFWKVKLTALPHPSTMFVGSSYLDNW